MFQCKYILCNIYNTSQGLQQSSCHINRQKAPKCNVLQKGNALKRYHCVKFKFSCAPRIFHLFHFISFSFFCFALFCFEIESHCVTLTKLYIDQVGLKFRDSPASVSRKLALKACTPHLTLQDFSFAKPRSSNAKTQVTQKAATCWSIQVQHPQTSANSSQGQPSELSMNKKTSPIVSCHKDFSANQYNITSSNISKTHTSDQS